MEDIVEVSIPVSRAAAEALARREAKALAGRIISAFARPDSPEDDPMAVLIAQLKAEVRAVGLTDEDIDAELAACNAERRT